MKILIIVDDYLPFSKQVAAKMTHELAIEYLEGGHEVTVLTPNHRFNEKFKITTLDGIRVVYFKSGPLKSKNKIKRAINESLLSYRAWIYGKEFFNNNPHDYIIYYSPSIFFGSIVKKLKNLWSVRSYLILRDIFPQWAVDYGIIKKGSIVEKYLKYFELKNYAAADTIGVMSKKNLDWIKEHRVNQINKKTKIESRGSVKDSVSIR